MKKQLLIAAAILFCCAVAWGLYLYKKPRTGVVNAASFARLDATVLYNRYHQNEIAADKEYAGKVLTIKGIVEEVQHTDSTLSISLHGGADGGVNCSFAAVMGNAVAPVKGAAVIIKGRCAGFLVDVNLVDCVVE